MKHKEFFWVIGTAIFVLILNFFLFGVDGLKSESVSDIYIYDTYFVIENINLILLISVFIFFSVYIIRVLKRNFKNLTANLIFIIIGVLSIWIVIGMFSIVNSYIEVTQTTEYNLPVTTDMFENFLKILYLSQITIIGLVAFVGFKTGQNYKLSK